MTISMQNSQLFYNDMNDKLDMLLQSTSSLCQKFILPASEVQDWSVNRYYYEKYLPFKLSRIKLQSYIKLQEHFNNRILPILGNKKIWDIRADDLFAWQSYLIKENLSNLYINKIHISLMDLLHHVSKYFGLELQPLDIDRLRVDPKEMQFWTIDEFLKGLNVQKSEKYRLVLSIMFFSGVRKGEFFGLCYKDVIRPDNVFHIRQQFQRIRGVDFFTPPKYNSQRMLVMPSDIIEILKNKQNQEHASDDDLVFKYDKRLIERAISISCEVAGVKRIRVHDLRHSSASYLLRVGMNPLLVSKRLGHKNVSITLNRYGHFYPQDEEITVNAFPKIF